jgi:hypothetical protein
MDDQLFIALTKAERAAITGSAEPDELTFASA